jgi:hypothetical protein
MGKLMHDTDGKNFNEFSVDWGAVSTRITMNWRLHVNWSVYNMYTLYIPFFFKEQFNYNALQFNNLWQWSGWHTCIKSHHSRQLKKITWSDCQKCNFVELSKMNKANSDWMDFTNTIVLNEHLHVSIVAKSRGLRKGDNRWCTCTCS